MGRIKLPVDRIFRSRFSLVLLATGFALLVATLLADLFWGRMFEAIYGSSVGDRAWRGEKPARPWWQSMPR